METEEYDYRLFVPYYILGFSASEGYLAQPSGEWQPLSCVPILVLVILKTYEVNTIKFFLFLLLGGNNTKIVLRHVK